MGLFDIFKKRPTPLHKLRLHHKQRQTRILTSQLRLLIQPIHSIHPPKNLTVQSKNRHRMHLSLKSNLLSQPVFRAIRNLQLRIQSHRLQPLSRPAPPLNQLPPLRVRRLFLKKQDLPQLTRRNTMRD